MKSHDVVVLCKIFIMQYHNISWTFASLAKDIFLSVGETHNSVKRLKKARLFDEFTMSIIPQAMIELLVHGVKYVYPPEIGSIERGIPTSHSAPVFEKEFVQSDEDVYIWPDSNGKKRGRSVTPLSKNAAKAALMDEELYDMLALIDALRIGRARERNLAAEKLKSMVEKMDNNGNL